MKRLMAVILATVLFSPSLTLACSANDFKIANFKMKPARVGSMAKLTITGKVTNNCADDAGIQLAIYAKDKNGQTLDTQKGWPLGSTNIPAGATVNFHFGALFSYSSKMKSFSSAIVATRKW